MNRKKFNNKRLIISISIGFLVTLGISLYTWFGIVDPSILQGTYLNWLKFVAFIYLIPSLIGGIFLGFSGKHKVWLILAIITYTIPILLTLFLIGAGGGIAQLS